MSKCHRERERWLITFESMWVISRRHKRHNNRNFWLFFLTPRREPVSSGGPTAPTPATSMSANLRRTNGPAMASTTLGTATSLPVGGSPAGRPGRVGSCTGTATTWRAAGRTAGGQESSSLPSPTGSSTRGCLWAERGPADGSGWPNNPPAIRLSRTCGDKCSAEN